MEERPTHRVYIEILTCCSIFCHLEDSRSHGNEREGDRAHGQGARPPLMGACLPLVANHVQPHRLCSTDLKDQGEPFNQCWFDLTAQIHLKRLYKQGPWPLEEIIQLFISIFSREDLERGSLGFPPHRP